MKDRSNLAIVICLVFALIALSQLSFVKKIYKTKSKQNVTSIKITETSSHAAISSSDFEVNKSITQVANLNSNKEFGIEYIFKINSNLSEAKLKSEFSKCSKNEKESLPKYKLEVYTCIDVKDFIPQLTLFFIEEKLRRIAVIFLKNETQEDVIRIAFSSFGDDQQALLAATTDKIEKQVEQKFTKRPYANDESKYLAINLRARELEPVSEFELNYRMHQSSIAIKDGAIFLISLERYSLSAKTSFTVPYFMVIDTPSYNEYLVQENDHKLEEDRKELEARKAKFDL